MKPRNILVVTGTFTTGTWLLGDLHLVQSGSISPINSWTVGRCPNRIGDGIWNEMTFTLALGDKDTPYGHITHLGIAGHTRGAGEGGEVSHTVKATASAVVMPGCVTPGEAHIAYVEGDREPIVDRGMTLHEFAAKNGGNYLVVTLRLQ